MGSTANAAASTAREKISQSSRSAIRKVRESVKIVAARSEIGADGEEEEREATTLDLDLLSPFLFFLAFPPLPQLAQPTTTTTRRRKTMTTTTRTTTQKPRKRPARTLVPGGLDASAFAPAPVVAAAPIPSPSSRRPAGAPLPPPPTQFDRAPASALAYGGVGEEAETEYERQRAERIRRNTEMLNALRVPEAAARAARASTTSGRPPRLFPRAAAARPRAVRGSFQPTRASARARGLEPGTSVAEAVPGEGSSDARGGAGAAAAARAGALGGGALLLLPGRPDLLTIEEYWRQRGGNPCSDPLVSDGSYRG